MKQVYILELNEYIEKMSEIKPLLDQLGETISLETIVIENDGCKPELVAKISDYLKGFDLNIEVMKHLITLDEVKKAMRMVANPMEYLNCMAIEKQIAKSLEVYLDRAEYIDGNLKSALDCLRRAKFEIEVSK